MDDDALIITCPCCSAQLGFDDAGDAYVVEDAPLHENQRRGLAGLVVEDVIPDWNRTNYFFNQDGHKAEPNAKPLTKANTPFWAEPDDAAVGEVIDDPAIIAANAADLKTKNLI